VCFEEVSGFQGQLADYEDPDENVDVTDDKF